MDNASLAPQPKVVAAGLAGAVTTLIVYGVKVFAGIDLPAEVASALTLIISTAGGYLTPNR